MLVHILLCTVVIVAAYPQIERSYFDLELADLHFEDYIIKFNKQYTSEAEKLARFQIFKDNLAIINARNRNSSAIHGLTPFTDWTHEEFMGLNGYRPQSNADTCNLKTDADFPTPSAPDSFDWRKQNGVTPVKNQMKCGSCWAFSTVANIESQNAIKTRQTASFSEQQLVDCVQGTDCQRGGDMQEAMRTIISQGGLESDQDYPYVGSVQKCAFDKSKGRIKLSECNHYQLQSEDSLKEALHKFGPLSISVNAHNLDHYNGHLVDRDLCPEGDPNNHAVLLVGYGTENDVPVWYIKNSWGSNWGNGGFFTMRRNANMCGILAYSAASAILA